MEDVPLLPPGLVESCPTHLERVTAQCPLAGSFLQDLLFTARPEYLGLSNRRSCLWCQFFGYSISAIVFDLIFNGMDTFSDRMLVGADVLLALCMLTLVKLDVASIRLDYSIAFVLAVYCMLWRAVKPENDLHWLAQWYYNEFLFFFVAGTTGLHASAQLMFVLLVLPPALITGQYPMAFTCFVLGMVSLTFSLRMDLHCADLYKQLREKSHSLETLLDHATDGFCEIDAAEARVIHASSKLKRTLVNEDVHLQSMNFDNFLSSDVDKEKLRGLFEDTAKNREVRPQLVTCQTLTHTEFDAKLIPYCSSKGKLKLCLVKLGELRDLALSRSQEITKLGDEASEHGDEGDEDFAVHVHECEERTGNADNHETAACARDTGAMSLISGWSSFDAGVRSTLAYSQTHTEFSSYDSAESGRVVSDEKCQTIWTQTPPVSDEKSHTFWSQRSDSRVRSQECQTELPLMAAAAASKRPPLLPCRKSHYVNFKTRKPPFRNFKATRPEIIDALIEDFLAKLNPRGKGCCSFHVGLVVLSRHLLSMAEQSKCKKEPLPAGAWQCHHCTVVNDDDLVDGRVCSFCLSSPDGEDSNPVQSELEVVTDDSSSCAADVEDGDAISGDENLSG